jgi:hypothetical protein
MTAPDEGERVVARHCPYCGEEDLWPRPIERGGGEHAGPRPDPAWECHACARVFAVSFLGLLPGLRVGWTGGDR